MPGWFDEQLRARIQADDESFSEAFTTITQAVTGRKVFTRDADGAIAEIAGYFSVPESVLKKQAEQEEAGLDEKLEYIFGTLGIMRRIVNLTEGWYHDASGVYLAMTKGGHYVALMPDYRGYTYRDYETGKTVRVNSSTQHNLNTEAICFYRPLPAEKLGVKDLLKFAAKSLSVHDVVYMSLVTLAVILVSMVSPFLTRIIFTHYVHAKEAGALVPLFVFMAAAGISGALLTVAKMLLLSRIQVKADVAMNAAVMMRVINLLHSSSASTLQEN